MTSSAVSYISPAYIAGVTNPIFEAGSLWDLIFDVAGGRVIISKDIHLNSPTAAGGPPPLLRAGTFQGVTALNGDDDLGRVSGKDAGQKGDYVAKADNTDNVFMEDVHLSFAFVMTNLTVKFDRSLQLYRITLEKAWCECGLRNTCCGLYGWHLGTSRMFWEPGKLAMAALHLRWMGRTVSRCWAAVLYLMMKQLLRENWLQMPAALKGGGGHTLTSIIFL
jgi:hypothetical protein